MSKNHWKKGSGSVSSSRNIDWCLANSRRQEIRILASEKDRSRSEPGTERRPPTPYVCAPSVPPFHGRELPGSRTRPDGPSDGPSQRRRSGVVRAVSDCEQLADCQLFPAISTRASWRSDATGYYGIPDGPVEWS
ncbi:hypothetical protein GE21DRAFT_5378 [Neurospora crassa]|uniref:Uncharacterized protein n=1 Tax=Neurospora crassa (strain ATCC 24698 / 74-OR23-1A / CBS 708.71 / DSM 1257 / FGSC 987) TaxID=367110 RepID=Q7S3U2_NEUCR|nr:hypothetical protein NCU04925 [Neurospora crassa OR74A]EAA30137.1 hypothetical protein NCU04925 [Neurospora crassa OR74A]KHE79315.1 hypothetical protein GE21DRAFT_5378 [Neurospora crassa]|eukprot:XP_959373.1 hypothetical protein NCU04925 [Neurospora crassa OR74A]